LEAIHSLRCTAVLRQKRPCLEVSLWGTSGWVVTLGCFPISIVNPDRCGSRRKPDQVEVVCQAANGRTVMPLPKREACRHGGQSARDTQNYRNRMKTARQLESDQKHALPARAKSPQESRQCLCMAPPKGSYGQAIIWFHCLAKRETRRDNGTQHEDREDRSHYYT